MVYTYEDGGREKRGTSASSKSSIDGDTLFGHISILDTELLEPVIQTVRLGL
jgi:hypothetical protein